MKSSVSWFQHRQLILSGSLGGSGERRVDFSIVRAVSIAADPRISIFPRGVEVKRKSSVTVVSTLPLDLALGGRGRKVNSFEF